MLSACSSEEGGSQAMGGKGAVILDLAAGLQGENLGCARPCGIGL